MNQPLTMLDDKRRQIESRIDTARVAGTTLNASSGGLSFQNVTEAMEFSKLMSLSDIAVRKHLRGNPGACLGVVVQAVEWGMSPYAVANKSYMVNDQLAYESQLIQAVILRRAPIKGRIRYRYEGEGGKRVCFASAVTVEGDTVEYESPPFDKITPKNSPLWKNDPDQQQAYYSGRALCRRHFPDVLLGIYDREELDGEQIKDITPPPASGFAARLQQRQGGFDADGVSSALDEAVGASADQSSNDTAQSDPASPDANGGAERDPECVRAGEQALIDGEVREAPTDFTEPQKADWLFGYDGMATATNGGRG